MIYDNLLVSLIEHGSARISNPDYKWLLYLKDISLIFKESIDNSIQISCKKDGVEEELLYININEIPSFIPTYIKKLELNDNHIYSNNEKIDDIQKEVEIFRKIIEKKILNLSLEEFEKLEKGMPRNLKVIKTEKGNHFISIGRNDAVNSNFSFAIIEASFVSSDNRPVSYNYYYSIQKQDKFKLLKDYFNQNKKNNLFDLLSEKTKNFEVKSIIATAKLAEVLDSKEKPVRMKKT